MKDLFTRLTLMKVIDWVTIGIAILGTVGTMFWLLGAESWLLLITNPADFVLVLTTALLISLAIGSSAALVFLVVSFALCLVIYLIGAVIIGVSFLIGCLLYAFDKHFRRPQDR